MTVKEKAAKRFETGKTGLSTRMAHKVGRAKLKAREVESVVLVTKTGGKRARKVVAPHGLVIRTKAFADANEVFVSILKDRRAELIKKEGYDPRFMFEALQKTSVPTQKEWAARVSQATKAVEKATTAPFLDKFRLVEN